MRYTRAVLVEYEEQKQSLIQTITNYVAAADKAHENSKIHQFAPTLPSSPGRQPSTLPTSQLSDVERMVYDAEKEIKARNERVEIAGPALVLGGEMILLGVQPPAQGAGFSPLRTGTEALETGVTRLGSRVDGYASIAGKIAKGGGCFAAGTRLRTPDGAKAVDHFKPGDLILSRDQLDPTGPIESKMVEEIFVRTDAVWEIHIGEQVIQTTGEHPFFTRERHWIQANELRVGDALLGIDGLWVPVKDVIETQKWEPVYNLRVSDFHTYFVGCDEWGFSVWVHNDCGLLIFESGAWRLVKADGTVLYRSKIGEKLEDILANIAKEGHVVTPYRQAAGIANPIDLTNPANIYGLDGKTLQSYFESQGYSTTTIPPNPSSSQQAQIFSITNHPTIAKIQYHPGTGTAHPEAGAYYKIELNNGNIIRVIDPTKYGNPGTIPAGTTFFNNSGQQIIWRNGQWVLDQ